MELDDGATAPHIEMEAVGNEELRYAFGPHAGSICGHLQVTVIA